MEHKKEWYILINGEKIEVSREVYLEYYRPAWHTKDGLTSSFR